MKNLLKKSAVATAVAGSLMISSMASADSVLAPLVIGIDNGTQTFFSLKVRGSGAVNNRMASMSDLHYVWFKKNLESETGAKAIDSLDELGRPCEVSNNNGRVSPWDMVFQRAVGNSATARNGGQMNLLGAGNDSAGAALTALDLSQPNGYTAGDFVGFAVITDNANKNSNPAVKDLANEGELSGFGYIVDATSNFVMDYKLLNNHRSKVEGDFSATFISKKSVDFSWMPTGMANTEWYVLAAGDDMLKADSGAGSYDATVYLSQDTASGSVSPQLPTGGSGVYNNDEKVTSGAKNVRVTCIARLDRGDLLSTLQAADTTNGGWKRMSIQNSTTRPVGDGSSANTTQVASGAMIYKAETIDFRDAAAGWVTPEGRTATNPTAPSTIMSTTQLSGAVNTTRAAEAYGLVSTNSGNKLPVDLYKVMSFQPETSGHLSATPEPHPNRPY